ncbi:hypothetical protein [Priestia megaterium]|uniref:hypothetical protein n=1 Tax=Priestia megaterium TaxID=1404 RepID=UPI00366B3EDD
MEKVIERNNLKDKGSKIKQKGDAPQKDINSRTFFQNINIDIAIIITLLTVLSYTVVYIYNLSKYHYYHIPLDLIDINLKNVVWVLFVVLIISAALYSLSIKIMSHKFFEEYYSNVLLRRKFYKFFRLITIISLILIVMDKSDTEFFHKHISFPDQIFYLVMGILYIYLFISLTAMLKKHIENNNLSNNRLNRIYFGGLLVSFLSIPYFLGGLVPIYFESHYIINDNSPSVVLGTYKDKFIVAPVDLDKKVITPKFSFIKIETDKSGKLQVEPVETGRLIVKKTSTVKELIHYKQKRQP